jgi:hypothetical protein
MAFPLDPPQPNPDVAFVPRHVDVACLNLYTLAMYDTPSLSKTIFKLFLQ